MDIALGWDWDVLDISGWDANNQRQFQSNL